MSKHALIRFTRMNRRRFVQSLGIASLATQLPGAAAVGRRRAPGDDQTETPGARRHGRARQPGQRDVQHRRSADREGVARGARLQGARSASTCWSATATSPATTRRAPTTSTRRSPTSRSPPSTRSAAAGAARGCCRTSTSTASAATRRSSSATATSPRCCSSIHAKTGLVTFHGPIGLGRWDPYSLDYYKRVLFNGEQVTYTNKQGISADRNA